MIACQHETDFYLSSGSKKNDDYKQQWQISYAGKRQLEGDPKEVFVTEFFIINVETGKYLTLGTSNNIAHLPWSMITECYFVIGDSGLSVSLSSPKFDGESRWVLVNRRITEKNQAFDDRYMYVSFNFLFQDLLTIFCRFYTWKTKLVLACNGTEIISISYDPEDENPSEQSQWHIVDNITS